MPMMPGAGPAPAMPPQVPKGPAGSPMAQPSPSAGNKQMGMVNVESAMQLLEQALPSLGSNTPEGAAVIRAISALSKNFMRQKAEPLIPAQIMELARAQGGPAPNLGGGGGAPPGAAPPQPM